MGMATPKAKGKKAKPAAKKPRLSLYTNDTDFVIASSPAEARSICAKECGITPLEAGPFKVYSAAKTFTLFQDPYEKKKETKTVSAWIKEHGKGYFACSEY
jgi:hypothetical protein